MRQWFHDLSACVVFGTVAISVACSGGGGFTTADPNACACLVDFTGKGYPPEIEIAFCFDLVALDDGAKDSLGAGCAEIQGQCTRYMGTYSMNARCSTASFLGHCEHRPKAMSSPNLHSNRIYYMDPSGTEVQKAKNECTQAGQTWTDKK